MVGMTTKKLTTLYKRNIGGGDHGDVFGVVRGAVGDDGSDGDNEGVAGIINAILWGWG